MSAEVSILQAVSYRAFRAARSAPGFAVLFAPMAVLVYLLRNPALDGTIHAYVAHFYIVTFVSLVGFAISALMTLGGGRMRDARAFFLNLGFLGISGIFVIHALSTPGVLLGANASVGLAARLSIFAGSIAFAMSGIRWNARVNEWISARWRLLLAAMFAVWIVMAALAIFAPEWIEHGLLGYEEHEGETEAQMDHAAAYGPPPGELGGWSGVMGFGTVGLLGFAAKRYFGEYLLTALPAQGTLVAGMVLLGQAQVAMWLAPTWALSWWGYHILMLAGFLTSVVGFGLTYARRRSLPGIVESLFLTDTIERIESSYSDAIFALVAAVEARDRYTTGHSSRVSQMSVLIGEAMRLPGAQLRSLGRGGLVHDVGKLSVPDAILSKPGPLTAEEYAIVKQHPEVGYRVIKRVGSLREELPMVLHHHEWFNGRGYPHGLARDAIPLSARILAVADVYDALTSERPYRPARSEDEALAHLQTMRGTQFDPRIVDVFARIEPQWRERRRRTRALNPRSA